MQHFWKSTCKDAPAFTIYGVASDTKSKTLLWTMPSDYNIKRDLSNNLVIIEWLAFSNTSELSRNIS